MWSPVPKAKVIRRPRPLENYNHQRRKLVKKKNPLQFRLENHYGDRYFGIRHSDITDHLEKQVPSHAFAPANITTRPPTNNGRGKIGQQVRPSTAPAAIPWFGRTSSDVSDWLRQLPPAHLGSDPDNKPLPYFPTKSSIVTDNRWQTRDFPPVPNVLWHYWAERPSSAPLATAPHQVQFDTILDAIKKSRPKPSSNSSNPEPESNFQTPRSARSNPGSQTGTPRVAETPRGTESGKGSNQSRPCSATGGKPPPTPPPGAPEVKAPETSRQCCQCGKRQLGRSSTMGDNHGKGFDASGSMLCKPCGCGKAQDTPRSSTPKSQEPSPRSPKQPETPQTPDKVGNNKPTTDPCPRNGYNTPGSGAGIPRPQTPKASEKKPACASQRPPLCPTTLRQKGDLYNCPKAAPVPFHEVIRNSRKGPENQGHPKNANGKGNEYRKEATADEFRAMSPDSYATKVVWQDNFRNHNKGYPWPIKVH